MGNIQAKYILVILFITHELLLQLFLDDLSFLLLRESSFQFYTGMLQKTGIKNIFFPQRLMSRLESQREM